jgi:hypothetical protein
MRGKVNFTQILDLIFNPTPVNGAMGEVLICHFFINATGHLRCQWATKNLSLSWYKPTIINRTNKEDGGHHHNCYRKLNTKLTLNRYSTSSYGKWQICSYSLYFKAPFWIYLYDKRKIEQEHAIETLNSMRITILL